VESCNDPWQRTLQQSTAGVLPLRPFAFDFNHYPFGERKNSSSGTAELGYRAESNQTSREKMCMWMI
jgi:hypothetical protein